MSQPENELRALPDKWRKSAIESREEAGRIRRTVHEATDAEANCYVRAELWDKNADELDAALASRAPATTPTPPVEQLVEAARLIDLLSHEDGRPADGFRFREGIQSMRDALIQLGRAPFQDERVAQAPAPGDAHEIKLLKEMAICPVHQKHKRFCVDCATELERRASYPLQDKPPAAPATTPTPEVCKCYKDNDYDFYAAVMTGVASEWTVTEDCPIHRDALAAQDKPTP